MKQPTSELKNALTSLENDKQDVVIRMIHDLSSLPGIQAIVLGGSYARGMATADSDVDLGLYYSENSPPSIESIKDLAAKYSVMTDCVVTQFYEWGPWVNGGSWIHTKAGKIDWLYRNVDQINRVLADAERGAFSWDFRQQPPFGFFSVTYLADLHDNIILHDPHGLCKILKSSVGTYPDPLRRAIIQEHLWSVEFTLMNARKYSKRGCIYATVGCMTRMAAELTQVLFALNEIYFVTEKNALETIDTFTIRPKDYSKRMNAVLSHPGSGDRLTDSLKIFEEIVQEVIALANPIYKSKYKGLI
jgi:predicted nucleotidyltransferase